MISVFTRQTDLLLLRTKTFLQSFQYTILVISRHLTNCGAQICKPYILLNLCVTCSILLHSPMLCMGTVWRFLWNAILAFTMTILRGEEIGFRRLLLSFTATGLIKVTGWIYREFGIQIGSGNNNDQRGIFRCVLCDFANIRYRSVVAKLITRYTSFPFTKP